jgi:outer membrane protein OmpA-like peptidoglycan-associated protein
MIRPFRMLALAIVLALTVAPGAAAQSVADRLKAKAQQRLDSKADQPADRELEEFDGAFACVVGDKECPKRAKAKGRKVVLTDSSGTVLPAARQPADSPARQAREEAAPDKADQPAAEAAATPVQLPGQGAWANFDFVPGERVIFSEDFSRDRVGNFPQRLELVTGNMEVVEWKSRRWLRVSSAGAVTIPLPEKLGTRFTMEFDATIPWGGFGFYSAAEADKLGPLPVDRPSATVHLSGTLAGVTRPNSSEGALLDPRTLFADMFPGDESGVSRVFHIRMEADGRYVKVYMDEKRIANIPNADFGRANKIIFEYLEPSEDKFPLISNISVNAGGKKLYDALLADGRVSTQGILFDVGSDRIRGESTPTLKQIGDMLVEHPELKLAVEGHTDNTGAAAANQTLSAKRAQAIVTYLTSTFHVAAERLTPRGMGQTKPVKPNDTPEGRQANRRVELVKM